MSSQIRRRFAIGAEVQPGGGTHFRVWVPESQQVKVVDRSPERSHASEHALQPDGQGYHSGLVPTIGEGGLYSFRLDDKDDLYPDPASRFQPDGPFGASQVVNPNRFEWHDHGFCESKTARVLYELHLGTFTAEGTYRAAAAELAELAELGITSVELMPVAAFPGRFGWSYDGVDLWAPSQVYGSPDDLRIFVATAHEHGISVILDVVYNHLGPCGNFLGAFSRAYFSETYDCEWGEALNFDGPNSGPVREFFLENVRYWIEEFHLDGLRLDATQSIFDRSQPHILAELVRTARAAGEKLHKDVYVVGENEPQHTDLVRSPERGGHGLDALWNDDFHHTARVALTGRHEAYYTDYRGTPQELISALKWGYLYQGQYYSWQKQCRGTGALDLNASNFVTYLQNHDQIANNVTGWRLSRLSSWDQLRAMTALMLLSPPTPMLFQGQEFASSAPFLFFADHDSETSENFVRDRLRSLTQFRSGRSVQAQRQVPSLGAYDTFLQCKLDFTERVTHAPIYRLHRDLLRLRREDPAISQRRSDRMHGAVLGAQAFALRFLCEQGDRLLVVNFGADLELESAPEPLLAAPPSGWRAIWCSEDFAYGGQGFELPWLEGRFLLPAHSATLFAARPPRPEA
jgi:maltooligosyltrehalose trehalohydrolase